MKIKRIRIKSRKQSEADLQRVARALDRGEKIEPMIGEFFESMEAVRVMLTDKRLDVWRAIRDQRPASISELAKMVGRGFRSVHRDVRLLESVGLVALKKAKGKRGDVQAPVSLADELRLEVG